jgi:uncharacterized protein
MEVGAVSRLEDEGPPMFFSITELEHHPVLFDLTYAPGEIDFGEDLHQNGLLRTAGQAELLKNTLGEIRIRGTVQVDFDCVCHRCLEPAPQHIDSVLDLFFRPQPKIENHVEVQLEEGEIDLSFYEGDGVSLRIALRDYIILSQPMQYFCKPDCKGLCPHCGANRNLIACGCAAERIASKMASLREL